MVIASIGYIYIYIYLYRERERYLQVSKVPWMLHQFSVSVGSVLTVPLHRRFHSCFTKPSSMSESSFPPLLTADLQWRPRCWRRKQRHMPTSYISVCQVSYLYSPASWTTHNKIEKCTWKSNNHPIQVPWNSCPCSPASLTPSVLGWGCQWEVERR